MNNIIIPIKNLVYTVERPVILNIVRQLMDILQISYKTNILFNGDEAAPAQKGSLIDDKDKSINKWPYNDLITIEVSIDSDPDRVLSTIVNSPEHMYVFYDKDLNIAVRPVYITNKVDITFKYRVSDRNKAESWRNDIRAKSSMHRHVNMHDITYSYTLPEELFIILKEIHKLRETQAEYNEDYLTYLTKSLTVRGGTVSNLNGEKADWVISEDQNRIQGMFDFKDLPDKPQKVGDSSAYECSFVYSFSFEKPIEVNMIYPNVIHNNILEDKFIISPILKTHLDQNTRYSITDMNLSKFQTDISILNSMGNKGIHIPEFDSGFIPGSIPSGTSRIFTALCLITEDDKRSLFNFKQLGDYILHDSIIKFIEFDKENIVKTYKSVFTLDLYENNKLLQSNSLTIDNDLNVIANFDLDLRKTYRVRFGMVINLHFLNNQIMKKIREYGRENQIFTLKIAVTTNSILRDIGNRDDIQASHLSKDDLVRLGIIYNNYGDGSFIKDVDSVYHDNEEVKFNITQNMFVEPKQMSDYNKEQKFKYRVTNDYTLIKDLPESLQLSLDYWLLKDIVN